MNTLTIPKIYVQTNTQLEVIGHGEMITRPRQIGYWWVVPADQFDSTIPPEAMRKVYALINQGVKVKGILIADDIRKKELKDQEKRKKEKATNAFTGTALSILGSALTIAVTIAMGMLYIAVAALAYDPMLVAVLEDGRWICVHSWYD